MLVDTVDEGIGPPRANIFMFLDVTLKHGNVPKCFVNATDSTEILDILRIQLINLVTLGEMIVHRFISLSIQCPFAFQTYDASQILR